MIVITDNRGTHWEVTKTSDWWPDRLDAGDDAVKPDLNALPMGERDKLAAFLGLHQTGDRFCFVKKGEA